MLLNNAKFIMGLCLLINCCTIHAQEQFVMPLAKQVTAFKFKQLIGGVIIINAQLNNYTDTLNFVLDTGSGGISLDSATAAYYKLSLTPSNKTVKGIGGIRNISFANNHSLRVGNYVTDSLDFHINNYELLTSVYGVRIDGIIGYSFLRRYIVKINYDSSTITLYKPGVIKYPRGGYYLKPTFTNLPIVHVTVADSKEVDAKYYFDTGAGLCMLFNNEFVDDSAFFRKKRKFYNTQIEGIGGKQPMKITVIKSVKLGPYKFKNVPAMVLDDTYNVTNYPYLAGLIGNDVLRRFNTIINYPEQLFHLTPNSHYNDVFDYAYCGLNLYMLDGKIIITDIIKNSPADIAGFKDGDTLLAIDNNFSGDINVYKNLLQSANTKCRLFISRNGSPFIIPLSIKSILH